MVALLIGWRYGVGAACTIFATSVTGTVGSRSFSASKPSAAWQSPFIFAGEHHQFSLGRVFKVLIQHGKCITGVAVHLQRDIIIT